MNMTVIDLILLAELLLTAAGLCFVRGVDRYRVERTWLLAEQAALLDTSDSPHNAL